MDRKNILVIIMWLWWTKQ